MRLTGEDAKGIWTLSIFDNTNSDEGVLNSWSLSFGFGEHFQITDADGNYKFDNVVTGTYAVRVEG